jgi:succinoglycan biosynthesis protein ExoO
MLGAADDARADARAPQPARHISVSVLIPLYNSASTIERAVRSAQQQTLRDIEILVADDASTDDGPARVAAMAEADPRIRLLRLPQNGGKPRAMNMLAERAHGEWLAVLDADDRYHPERLATLLQGATRAGTDMAADNLAYIDAGIDAPHGRFVQYGFDPDLGDRILTKADLVRHASSYARFDFGILKPVIRRDFVRAHALRYHEASRLAEDFCYLMEYFVAGGRVFVTARATYDWTMPFGALSRSWTQTGAGPWRYDYRPAIEANRHFIAKMAQRGEHDVVRMLQRRARQYRVMVHYIDAQRLAASGRRVAAVLTLMRHPSTAPLLARRVAGRAARLVAKPAAPAQP